MCNNFISTLPCQSTLLQITLWWLVKHFSDLVIIHDSVTMENTSWLTCRTLLIVVFPVNEMYCHLPRGASVIISLGPHDAVMRMDGLRAKKPALAKKQKGSQPILLRTKLAFETLTILTNCNSQKYQKENLPMLTTYLLYFLVYVLREAAWVSRCQSNTEFPWTQKVQ